MAILTADNYRFYRDVSGTLTAISAAQDQSVSFSADEIDVSTKDTANGTAEYISGTKTGEFSGAGIARGDAANNIRELYADWLSGDTIQIVFTDNVVGNPMLSGDAKIFTFNMSSSGNAGPVTYDFSGKFQGLAAMTDVPA